MRTATLTASIRRQGVSRTRRFIQDRKAKQVLGADYHTADERGATRHYSRCRPGQAKREPGRRSDTKTGGQKLQNKPAQIRVLGEVADVLLHVGGIDQDGLAMAVRCG